MTLDQGLFLLILGGGLYLFVSERLRVDVTAMLLLAALVLGMVNYPSVSVWTLFGSAVGRALRTPQALQRFNWGMAALLVLSLYPVLEG